MGDKLKWKEIGYKVADWIQVGSKKAGYFMSG
jgi:hypothetical protein